MKEEVFASQFLHPYSGHYTQQFRKKWLDDLPNLFERLQGRFSSDDEISLYSDFKDNIQSAQQFYADESLEDALSELYAKLDAHVSALENEKPASAWRSPEPSRSTSSSTAARSIRDI
jgi:acyl carrier protein phosphodiesterase